MSDGSALIRLINRSEDDKRELNDWMPAKHKQVHNPRQVTGDGFPASLRRAIQSFILACAIRKLRGQLNEHNSMLVHVTRFTRLQRIVYDQIDEYMARMRRALKYEASGPDTVWAELRTILEEDFRPTTLRLSEAGLPGLGSIPNWDNLAPTLAGVAERIKLKTINGQAADILDYENFKGEGIDVIAVGGDKLSRGLTLEGLTVSYFARQTDMYDTLLQMGRWFGYRPGYLDLCRLYTTTILKEAFEHIAVASDELRREFDFMQNLRIRPIEYGLKVLSHTKLKPTAAAKRRHATDVIVYETYAGKVSETKTFGLQKTVLENNRDALNTLVRNLVAVCGQPTSPEYRSQPDRVRSYKRSHLWCNVPNPTILDFLDNYETEAAARLADSKLWITYIREQLSNRELVHWNVALVNGDDDGTLYNVNGFELKGRLRKPDDLVNQDGGYRIKRLVTNRDVGIDLDVEAWDKAREYDPQDKLSGEIRREPTSQSNCWVRQRLGLNPLMLIYLPESEGYGGEVPIVGVAIAFPGSENAKRRPIRYTVNAVYLEELARGEKIEL